MNLEYILTSRCNALDILATFIPSDITKSLNKSHHLNREYIKSIVAKFYMKNLADLTRIPPTVLTTMSHGSYISGNPIRVAMGRGRSDITDNSLHIFVQSDCDLELFHTVAAMHDFNLICVPVDVESAKLSYSCLVANIGYTRDGDNDIEFEDIPYHKYSTWGGRARTMFVYVGGTSYINTDFKYFASYSLGNDYILRNGVFREHQQTDTGHFFDCVDRVIATDPYYDFDLIESDPDMYISLSELLEYSLYSHITKHLCDNAHASLRNITRVLGLCDVPETGDVFVPYGTTAKRFPWLMKFTDFGDVRVFLDIRQNSDLSTLESVVSMIDIDAHVILRPRGNSIASRDVDVLRLLRANPDICTTRYKLVCVGYLESGTSIAVTHSGEFVKVNGII